MPAIPGIGIQYLLGPVYFLDVQNYDVQYTNLVCTFYFLCIGIGIGQLGRQGIFLSGRLNEEKKNPHDYEHLE